jgi:general secretion pathway protein C
MVSFLQSRWAVAGSTFVLWALVAASVVYWGLKLIGGGEAAIAPLSPRSAAPADPVAVARLLGASPKLPQAPSVPNLASRFSLVGVVASRARDGAALIAVDGKPPKPFRVGAPVDEGLVLQSVEARRAQLAASMQGPAVLTLELPPLRK